MLASPRRLLNPCLRLVGNIADIGRTPLFFAFALPCVPVCVAFGAPSTRDTFALCFELLCELAATAVLLTRAGKGEYPSLRWLAASLTCLLVADINYNLGVALWERYPWNYVGDFGYSAYLATLAIALASGGGTTSFLEKAVFALLSVGMFALQSLFVLHPILSLRHDIPEIASVNAVVYAAFMAILGAQTFLRSIRCMSWLEHVFLQGVLIGVSSDFAARYAASSVNTPQSSWAEWGWATSVGAVCAAAIYASFADHKLFDVTQHPRWKSVRAVFGLFGFLGNCVLLAGLLGSSVLAVEHGTHLSVILFLFCPCWFASNTLALAISTHLRRVRTLMPDPQTVAPVGDDYAGVSIPEVTVRLHLEEMDTCIAGYNDLALETNRLLSTLLVKNREAACGRLASQVAHDIRSPLSALKMALNDLASPSEETRVLLRSAILRVQDIANQLLDANRPSPTKVAEGKAPDAVYLPPLVESVVSEKRFQFRSCLSVRIESSTDKASYGAFSAICPVELKRVLSNLINNAVEALRGEGTVTVTLMGLPSGWEVRVTDTGQGMPPEVLAKLGQRGMSFAKEKGNGLGVFHAMQAIAACGGRLRFESEQGKGTSAIVCLSVAALPEWFLPRIDLTGIDMIVALDDDSSIHGIWEERFATAKRNGLRVEHLSTGDAFARLVTTPDFDRKSALFLVDYELLGQKKNGLDLVEDFDLGPRAVLVTSRFDEAPVVERARALGMRLLPKSVASDVPISTSSVGPVHVVSEAGPDAVLIDDDMLVHTVWKIAARTAKVDLLCFYSAESFDAHDGHVHPETPIYVDYELGDGLSGEAVTKELNRRGFGNLFLATGHAPGKFPEAGWLQGVVGKEPPF